MARLASLDSETLAFGTGIARFARKPRGRGRPLPASGCGPGAGREIAGRSGQRGLGYPNDMAKKSSGARKRGAGTRVRDAVTMVRAEVESGETPEGLEGAKMLMLVNRETGKGLGVTLFDSEEAMRRGDAALNAMNPGANERRTSVDFYEVPVQTVAP